MRTASSNKVRDSCSWSSRVTYSFVLKPLLPKAETPQLLLLSIKKAERSRLPIVNDCGQFEIV